MGLEPRSLSRSHVKSCLRSFHEAAGSPYEGLKDTGRKAHANRGFLSLNMLQLGIYNM